MKPQKTNRNRSRHGGTLLSIVIGLTLVSILGASMAQLLHRSGRGQAQAYDIARARYLAESGINYAIASGQLDAFSNSQTAHVRMLAAMEGFSVAVTQQTNGLYHIEAVGSTGIGTGRETHQKITRSGIGTVPWDPDTGPPPIEENPAGPPIHEDFTGGGQVSWRTSGRKTFVRAKGDIGSGNWLRTDLSATGEMAADAEQSDHYIGNELLHLEEHWRLDPAWKANDRQISYEAQVKMLWEYDRWYGAQGLGLAISNNDNQTRSPRATGCFVSLMRYATEGETGRYQATFDYNFDGIPNSIKPPGLAGHRLLVVWTQLSSGNKREWIAYKNLGNYVGLPGEAAVDWTVDWDDGQSGMCFKDYTTIGARMIEGRGDSVKYRYLQVLRADAKTGIVRAGNAVGNDINENRAAYPPEALGGTFPRWSPLDFNEWSAPDDVFSILGTLSGDPLETVTWDGVNLGGSTAVVLMPDQATLRFEEFTTTDDPTEDWEEKDFEIALNAVGNFNDSMLNTMYYDDFGVRFLKTKTDEEMVPGVQY